ncbi:MAG: hypothetical protein JNM58_14875 [Xanthomonadaceae bacterium]|nr:hypothetical protein [Xanthomonadaceae bacterium]
MSKRPIAILLMALVAACGESSPPQSRDAKDAATRELMAEAQAAVALANESQAASGTTSTQTPSTCPDTERPIAPPPQHTLRLTVRDAKTHQPVEGVVMDVVDARDRTRTRSDASGVALIDSRGLPSVGEVAIHCPGIEQGPMLPRRVPAPLQPYRLKAGRADLLVHVDLARCETPEVVSRKVRMRGMYVRGLESSQFHPCDGLPPESADFEFGPHSAWTEFTPEAEDDMAFAEWRERAFGDGVLYAEWSGVLSGPGSYGHWGMSLYEMRVETVHDTGMSQPSDCRAPGFEARGRL